VAEELWEAEPARLPSLALAYIGDAVYELWVRKHVMSLGLSHPDDLHRSSIGFVCAGEQARVARNIAGRLSEEELAVLRRGRNAKGHDAPKNVSVGTYRLATGLEALVGYWFLAGKNDRLEWFFGQLWHKEAE